MVWYEPLNLEQFLVWDLAGAVMVFIILAFFLIAILAAKFRMTGTVLWALIAIFVLLFTRTQTISSDLSGFTLLLALGLGLGIAYMLSRLAE